MTRSRTSWTVGVWAALWFIGPALGALSRPEPVALVTDLVGGALLQGAEVGTAVEVLQVLAADATLVIEPGARLVVVYYASGTEFALAGPATVRLGARAPDVVQGAPAAVRAALPAGSTVLRPERVQTYAQGGLSLRGERGRIRLLSPVNTAVLGTPLAFSWEPLAEDTQYRFVLSDEEGRTRLEALVSAPALTLPEQLDLTPGAYYTWRVEAHLASGASFASAADFHILDAAARALVLGLQPRPGASFSERVVYAALLDQQDLREEARRWWRALHAERPDLRLVEIKAGR